MDMNEQIMLIHPLVWNREDDRDVRALFVRDLVVAARIGVHHQEQGRTQNLRINLCAYLRPPYDWNDRLADVLGGGSLRASLTGHRRPSPTAARSPTGGRRGRRRCRCR